MPFLGDNELIVRYVLLSTQPQIDILSKTVSQECNNYVFFSINYLKTCFNSNLKVNTPLILIYNIPNNSSFFVSPTMHIRDKAMHSLYCL